MSCTTFVLLLMCLGASHSVRLTKEIDLSPAPQPSSLNGQFSTIINQLIQPAGVLASNLVTVLGSTIEPKVSDVLDAVNAGLGVKLLTIADDAVQLDAAEFEAALFRGAKDVSRALYPNDYLKQIAVYAVMQNKVVQISEQIQSSIVASKVSVKRFEEALKGRHFLVKRDIEKRDLFSDIYNSLVKTVESAICNTIVSEVQSFINSTLTSWITTLENIDVESSGDLISTILSSVVEIEIFFIEQGLNCSNQWLENDASTVCTSLISSLSESSTTASARKRRDVSQDLAAPMTRDIFFDLFGGIGGLIWGLLSVAVNPLLKVAVSTVLSLVESILNSIIDSSFQPLF